MRLRPMEQGIEGREDMMKKVEGNEENEEGWMLK
jgi:hypothetical protein